MRALGTRIGEQMRSQTSSSASTHERISNLADAMRTLGYESNKVEPAAKRELPSIAAHNCVFHHLAAKHPEVCHFDLALMAAATGAEVQHAEGMVRGGHVCRFRFRKPEKTVPRPGTGRKPRSLLEFRTFFQRLCVTDGHYFGAFHVCCNPQGARRGRR
jgi:hypothetical protein